MAIGFHRGVDGAWARAACWRHASPRRRARAHARRGLAPVLSKAGVSDIITQITAHRRD
jgi:hypothetical protein